MKIPVFVSAPTILNAEQEAARSLIVDRLTQLGLEERRLGKSEYPIELPLREVLVIARHCAGGLVLGFEQIQVTSGLSKRGTPREENIKAPLAIPTPWNHLESGILFGLGLPLLVFRDQGVTGGIFDPGVTDVFVHAMPRVSDPDFRADQLEGLLLRWQARVREHYYR